MSQLIFSALILLLSLSDQAQHISCDAPIQRAQVCWVVSPSTGVSAWLSPGGIVYVRSEP